MNNAVLIQSRSRTCWVSLSSLLFIHSIFVIPAIVFIHHAELWNPAAWDSTFHTQLIGYLKLHPLDIFSYPVPIATLPGYHLLLALFSSWIGADLIGEPSLGIRFINIAASYGLLVILWSAVWKLKRDVTVAFALTLPIACSYYVIASSIWINTDNFAALFYTVLMLVYIFNGPVWLGIIASVLMTTTRQLYLPVVAAFWPPAIFPHIQPHLLKLALGVTFFSSLIFGIFVWKWQGFTPTIAQNINKFVGVNVSGILHAFALSGILAIPYLPLFFSDRPYCRKK